MPGTNRMRGAQRGTLKKNLKIEALARRAARQTRVLRSAHRVLESARRLDQVGRTGLLVL
jgi:hypothetical protein